MGTSIRAGLNALVPDPSTRAVLITLCDQPAVSAEVLNRLIDEFESADSTIVASVTPALSLGGSLNVKVEEIAPTDDVAQSQAAALATLVTMARSFTSALGENTANRTLKELLKTAEVTQKRNRVVTTATVSPALLSGLAESNGAVPEPAR